MASGFTEARSGFSQGAEAAFAALRKIDDMSPDERMFLFNGAGIWHIVHEYKPDYIFDILDHKEELLAQRVAVGDTLVALNGYRVNVTWVAKDKIHFDGVWESGPLRGRTLQNSTMKQLGLNHTIE